MSINPLISLATYHWVSVLDAGFESHIFLCPSEVYQFSWKELHVSLTYIEPLPDCSVSSTIEASQLSTHCQGPGGLRLFFPIVLSLFQQVWLITHPPHLVYSGSTPDPHHWIISPPIRPSSSLPQAARRLLPGHAE